MKEEIKKIKRVALEEIEKASDLLILENLEKKYLGRKGLLRQALQKINQLSKEEKPKIGQLINETRLEIERTIQKNKLKKENFSFDDHEQMNKLEDDEKIDVSLPGEKISFGCLHPSTQLKNEVVDIFSSMGFEFLEGLEVDNEYYNFETLNIPADHPARDMWDTFYIKSQTLNPKLQTNFKTQVQNSKLLLRAHTSNMQVRVMEKRKPPLRVCVVGKCFRHEATDAKHEHTLYQIEGFVVDEKISMANLIYTLRTFLSALYKKEINIRIRPAYFPFVEPGLEIDMGCLNCAGKGCVVCKGSGWIEILGAGMIHPKVFKYAGYPPGKYTGFAFGVGLDRLAMMKHQIDDIRWLHSGDLRFIRQF